MSCRISADIGGTFTDIVLLDDETGLYRTAKVLTTPELLTTGIMQGMDEVTGGDYSRVETIVHGTTTGLNALIERKGAKTALVVTKGFRDVYEIARGNRPEMYNNRYQKVKPLVDRCDVYELDERALADGTIEKAPSKEAMEALAQKMKGGYEAVAVCFINSFTNPANERLAASCLREALGGGVVVVTSEETAPEWREYERMSTTVLNAYIVPQLRRHLEALNRELKKRDFKGNLYIMQSNGGIIKDEIAAQKAILTLMSGPVGGTIGAGAFDRDNLICVDMGGTSFDVSLVIDGQSETVVESDVEGFPALVPSVNIISVGAGGGSIAWSEGGGLRVGPMSAGSVPGPICYGRGGVSPTITDANLILGRIDPDNFLGSRMKLDYEETERRVTEFGAAFGLDLRQTAEGILRIINNKMADAIRQITIRRGIDPRGFTMFSFGGAGSMHAASIAEILGMEEVIVPKYPGVFSAWGMLQADVRHDAVRTLISPISKVDAAEVGRCFAQMKEELRNTLVQEGMDPDRAVDSRFFDLRYSGQEYTITIPVSDAGEVDFDKACEDFNRQHYKLYGHATPENEIELVNVRLTLTIPLKGGRGQKAAADGAKEPVPEKVRVGYFGGQEYQVGIYQRESLAPGSVLDGPAVIVEPTATTVLPPNWTLEIDDRENMILNYHSPSKEGVA